MKIILVPTDFSPNAEKALHFAVQVAKEAKAEVVLLHVCSGLIDTPFKKRQTTYNEFNETLIEKANDQLSSLKRIFKEKEKFTINIKLYRGPVADGILQAAEDQHADLIVMGTRGESVLLSKLFGSQTAAIISKTPIPIIAVPQLGEWVVPKNILFAVNDFNYPSEMIDPVNQLTVLFNAHIHAVTFTDENSADAVDYLDHKRDLSVYEKKLKPIFKNTGIGSVHLTGHKFRERIEEYILEERIDILAMVTHKRTFPGNIFNRSITKQMCYNTRIQLLAIPAPIQPDK